MSDRLYLSIWLKLGPQVAPARPFETLLHLFPWSRLAPALELTVRAISTQEPVLFEETFAGSEDLPQLVESLRGWTTPDLSVEVSAAWDLLRPTAEGWKLQPSRVTVIRYGPDFEREYGEDCRIEFGHDALFLPAEEAPGSFPFVEKNIRSLLKLVRDIDQQIPVEKRLLWSDWGFHFTQRLESLLAGGLG